MWRNPIPQFDEDFESTVIVFNLSLTISQRQKKQ